MVWFGTGASYETLKADQSYYVTATMTTRSETNLLTNRSWVLLPPPLHLLSLTHTDTHTDTHRHTHTQTHTHTHTHTHTQTHTQTHTDRHTQKHTDTRTHAHTDTAQLKGLLLQELQ